MLRLIMLLSIISICFVDSKGCQNDGSALKVSWTAGRFIVSFGECIWFESNDIMTTIGNVSYSLSGGNLRLSDNSNIDEIFGSDPIGKFSLVTFPMDILSDDGLFSPAPWIVFVKNYHTMDKDSEYSLGTTVFGQIWTEDVNITANISTDSVISSFPNFRISDSQPLRGYQTYSGNQMGHSQMSSGVWNSDTQLDGGISGTAPIIIFDRNLTRTCVLSPFSQFMATSYSFSSPGIVQYGVFGGARFIPKGFQTETILSCWSSGINRGVESWGAQLLNFYGKSAKSRIRDFTLNYLGLSTDNGAYYYYTTNAEENYQQTMKSVAETAKLQRIPFRYVLFDSWWYYRDRTHGNGVLNWTARPDIFPQGLEQVFEDTDWFVQAHNRHWSPNNIYAKQNGGKFDFIIENEGSIPLTQEFWEYLLGPQQSRWGLKVYEQDWLCQQIKVLEPLLRNITLGRQWMIQMGEGAASSGTTIQYSMAFPRQVLQSVEVPAVTQIRAGDDYRPGRPYTWRISKTSLFALAMGLAPSKDNFWSSPNTQEIGNHWSDSIVEPYSYLQSAASAFSAGPIAIGDKEGFWNADIVKKLCTPSGKLIVPDRPGCAIDQQFVFDAFNNSDYPTDGPNGEVIYSYSEIDTHRVSYVLTAELVEVYELSPSDIGLDSNVTYRAFEHNNTNVLYSVSEENPLRLSKNGLYDFEVWTIVRPFENGWSLLGDVSRWISVSSRRFEFIQTNSDEIIVGVIGDSHEMLTLNFESPIHEVVSVTCIFPPSGSMEMSSSGNCSSQNSIQ